jgi:AmmeMemoRadiSam system protein B/AmmeMemoRadiSam system protein A
MRLRLIPALLLCVLAVHVSAQTADRRAFWAGQFYPGTSLELRTALRSSFDHARPRVVKDNIIALVVPHAGYVYSGGVAASGYNQLGPDRKYGNVFILGPSHRVGFEGASVYVDGNFSTPLGTAQVNSVIGKQLLSASSVFTSRRDAHAEEHSVEVQIPFLQYRFGKDLRIVPIVLGSSSPATCKTIAEALRPYFNENNLFVISTDFSHYPPYEDAKRVDRRTAEAIASRSPDNLLAAMVQNSQARVPNLGTSVCGWPCVLTLLYLLEQIPSSKVDIIEYKNSGDISSDRRDEVVGYYALTVSLQQVQKESGFRLNESEKKELLVLARKTVEHFVRTRTLASLDASAFSKTLQTPCGAFVTLRKNNALRGCIGRFDATEPLYKVVQQMAVASSSEDYRFPPVSASEIDKLEVEISVLTPMRRIKSANEFELGKHGIYIRKGNNAGTFLPQVAAETGWTKEEFLGHCAQDKAGIGWDGWKDAELYVYEALVFSEKELQLR